MRLLLSLLLIINLQLIAQENRWLMQNIRVVDVDKGQLLPQPQDVLIVGDRIHSIANSTSNASPTDVKIIDGKDKFLIPGLWDMHAHPDDPEVWRMSPPAEDRDLLMPQFVLNGVTGIRDMAGSMTVIQQWRKLGREEELLVPRIVACGPLLDGPNPMWDGSVGIDDSTQVPVVVDSLIAQGSDFLKVYSLLPRSLYFTLSDYAAQQDIPMVGHVPFEVLPSEAAATGMKSQEHLLEILLECSSRRHDIMNKNIDYGNLSNPFDKYIYRQNLMMDTFDQERWQQLIAVYQKHGTWHTPTLSMWYKNAWYEIERSHDEELWPFLPDYLQKYWTPEHNDHLKYRDNENFLKLKKRLYGFYERLTLDLYQNGIKILAGTDVGANPLCWPGIGVHNELEALVKAGLTPAEALQTATCNPADFLELTDHGRVKENHQADLVILDSNPLRDIQAVRSIWGVVKNGHLYDPAERHKRLTEIKKLLRE
ncbi:MAG: amidohydrolase family protein [Cyclobacteriaceae bacterium]|nr:amidohydrolase family protein [Cyclobacteriaceae bacterium]